MRNSNITKNRIRVALLLVLAASIIGLGPAFSASARAGSFSINDVSGNYVELADGWTFGNGVVNFDPVSQVGSRHVHARDRHLSRGLDHKKCWNKYPAPS